jgi:hypothetical protein
VRAGGDASATAAATAAALADDFDTGAAAASALRPLKFDPAEHVVLAEELKHLYTAITRAKNNVRNACAAVVSRCLRCACTADAAMRCAALPCRR